MTTNTSASATYGVKLKFAAELICAVCSPSVTPSDADERRVLLQADEVVQQWREHSPDGLRQHDEAQRLHPLRPKDRAAAVWLGCTDSIPAL